jgi:hypothetical protein
MRLPAHHGTRTRFPPLWVISHNLLRCGCRWHRQAQCEPGRPVCCRRLRRTRVRQGDGACCHAPCESLTVVRFAGWRRQRPRLDPHPEVGKHVMIARSSIDCAGFPQARLRRTSVLRALAPSIALRSWKAFAATFCLGATGRAAVGRIPARSIVVPVFLLEAIVEGNIVAIFLCAINQFKPDG